MFFILSLIILVFAIIFLPKENIRFINKEIVFLQWWSNEAFGENLRSIIKDFERDNPGIKIKLQTVDISQVHDTLDKLIKETDAQSDSKKPDIAAFDPMWFDSIEKINLFENLAPYFSSQENINNINIDGNNAELGAYINLLYYNITTLQNSGFNKPPKTYEEFSAYCKKLKDRNNEAFYLTPNYFAEMMPWIVLSGADFSVSDGADFDWTSKKIAPVLDFFAKLNEENLIVFSGDDFDYDKKIQNFYAGKIPMMIAPSYEVTRINAKNPKINFSVTTIPHSGDNQIGTAFIAENRNIAMLTSSKNKTEASVFIRYIMERKAEIFAEKTNIWNQGSNQGIAESESESVNSAKDTAYAKIKGMEETGETISLPKIFKKPQSIETIFNEEITEMLKTQRGGKLTAAEIQKRYLEITQ
ncbi:MAG: sugar ABC transporter substrate-binding protein [Termitinemataceae bacterium]|nr:MAG: sugar ABC transporter substrate-binding protein [Termitinemataceae bacterium]